MQRNTAVLSGTSLRKGGIVPDPDSFDDDQYRFLRWIAIRSTLVFVASYLVLFSVMSLRPNVYDEGLVLTAAMRVAAGQIPHRDFYVNYGPAQFYVLAGLFNTFGTSILVERLFDVFIKALLVAAVYAIASFYCRMSIAVAACGVAFLWVFGVMNETSGAAMTPVSLLNLVGSALILPVFRSAVSTRRMLAAGAIAGTATLFRYDTGIALLGIQAFVMVIAIFTRLRGLSTRMRATCSALGPYLLGFVLLTLPPLVYYLSVAPLHPLIHDIFLYPMKYYHRSRNIPFPPISWAEFDQSAIYTTIVIILVSLCVAAFLFRTRRDSVRSSPTTVEPQSYYGLLITFGLLAFGMYFKGFVRVQLIHLFLSIIPASLLLAILVEHRSSLPRAVRIFVACLACLFVASSIWSARLEVRHLRSQTCFLAQLVKREILHRKSPEILREWCKTTNPLTKGVCFLCDEGHIRTIDFIGAHTVPGQKLFVGLTRHDTIIKNDNIIYFAAQRLPATKWSHFDPDLQNRSDVQAEIVHELDVSTPPYIVRDSEFDSIWEPNDSSRSSGVTLLDDYLQNKYQHIDTFGTMTLWQRQQ